MAAGLAAALGVVSAASFGLDAFAVRPDAGQQNPDLTATCGTDVIVVLDESASIASPTNYAPQVEGAVQTFVSRLSGTGSRMRLVEFSTNARDVTLTGGSGFQVVDDAFENQIDSYLYGGGLPQVGTSYNPSTVAGSEIYTNWESGLAEAAAPGSPATGGVGAPLVIFITDGNPNTTGTTGSSVGANAGNNEAGYNLASDAAIQEIAALQATGGHVLSIAVGDASSNQGAYDRLTNITEPGSFEQWVGTGDVQISSLDAMRVTYFDGLQAALQGVVFSLCGSSLTIDKTDDVGNPIAARAFELTVKSLVGGTSLEWQSPPSPGALFTAPSTKTLSTNANGTATFKWTPGTLASPQPWNSTVSFSEQLPPGWTAGPATCLVNGDPSSTFTLTPTITGTLASYGGVAGFAVNRADIVVCTVVNNRPATITVVKQADPADGTNFNFSTTSAGSSDPLPTSFALDVDTNATLPGSRTFTVDPGTYTITELAPGVGVYWMLESLNCTMQVQSPGSSAATNLSNRTATMTLLPGDHVTCTFVNDDVPAPQLSVVKTANPKTFYESGSAATYGIAITNPGTERVTITSMRDLIQMHAVANTSVDLNLASPAPGAAPAVGGVVTANSCDEVVALPTVLEAGQTVNCSFTITYSGRNAGQVVDDTVTVTGSDSFGRIVSAASFANVEVLDRAPVLTVDKQNVEVSIIAPGGVASYNLFVTNGPGASEPVTIRALADQMFVDATGAPANFAPFGAPINVTAVGGAVTATTCGSLIGRVLSPGATERCAYSINTSLLSPAVPLRAGEMLRNQTAVTAEDDEGTSVTSQDVADRPVLLTAALLDVWKTDGRATIAEPTSQITYAIWIDNTGTVGLNPYLTIESIVDDVKFRLASTDPIGASIGTVTITDAGAVGSFTKSGVSLVSTTCFELIGRRLEPSEGLADYPGFGADSPRKRPSNASARAECTITLQLPGNAGHQYDDTVTVNAIDPGESVLIGSNGANTPVVGTNPVLALVKTANPTTIAEPGGPVVFTFAVTNNSGSSDPVTITRLNDTVFGDLFAVGRTATNCRSALFGKVLAPGGSLSCTLTAPITGNAAFIHTNVATVTGVDDEGIEVSQSDDAQVIVTDAIPAIEVLKTAIAPLPAPVGAAEAGEDVTYRIDVINRGVETLILTNLIDDRFGNLNGRGTCATGATVAVGATYSCTFTGFVIQAAAELAHVNTVSASARDDENNVVSDSDDETVPFVLTPPSVTISKDDRGATVSEPGGSVTYTIVVSNPGSAVENIVNVTSLTDTITYADRPAPVVLNLLTGPTGDLTANDCPAALASALPLVPGESLTCQFTVRLSGSTQLVSDAVNVVAVDDDGQTTTTTGRDTTPITDVKPTVTIVKSANPTVINQGSPSTYTFVISNNSTFEAFHILSLKDDKFGDLTTGCWAATPPVLAPKGQTGDSVSCTQSLTPAFDSTGVHVNVATVAGGDDELIDLIRNPGEGTPPAPITASDNETVRRGANPVLTVTMSSVCVGNAPYINYDIKPVGFTPSGSPKLTFFDLDGVEIKSTTVTALTGKVLYPGVVIDADGKATDWPGWKLVDGQWVSDPSDTRWRAGLRIVVTLSPTAEANVTYPAPTTPCNGPPIIGRLPDTGGATTLPMLRLAVIVIGVGGILAAATRRRRRVVA